MIDVYCVCGFVCNLPCDVVCGVLCDDVWIVLCCVCLCGCFVDMSLCDVLMMYSVLSYGLWLRCCAFVRVGLHAFVRVVCALICDVV